MVCYKQIRLRILSINIGIGTFLLAICCAGLSGCENDLEKVNLVSGQKKIPSERAYDIEIIYSDSALLKARMLAKELDRFRDNPPYMEMPKGVKMYFYDESEKVNSTLTADYGKVLQMSDNNIMEARRNVIVVNEKGEKLNTEHLVWNQKEEKITSDVFVKITTGTEIIMGDGLESNQTFTRYKIKKIRGTLHIKK